MLFPTSKRVLKVLGILKGLGDWSEVFFRKYRELFPAVV